MPVFLDFHLDTGFGRANPRNPHPFAQRHAFLAKPRDDDFRELGIVLSERLEHFEHRDIGPQATMRLGEFQSDRTAAYDDQRRRQGGTIEDGLVGKIGNLVEPRDRRRGGAGARGDDEAPGLDLVVARHHRSRAGETAVLLDHGDAERLEPLHRIVRRDRGDDAVDVIVHRLEIDLRRAESDAEPAGAPRGLRHAGRRDQRLRRHAAHIEAIAAHPVALDQHHRRAHLRSARGDAEPARPRSDDAEIDPVLLHRRAPRSA